MKVAACLALLLVNVRLSQSCFGEGLILFCLDIPPAFPPGYSSLVMILGDAGEINSTVLRSDNLTSVTRLRIEAAGATAVAEGAFTSFQNLTNLSLKQNFLREINPGWFARPDILSELNLSGNQIEVLNEFMLNGLIGLTRLSLNKNRIRTIGPNSFDSQTVLAELDLSENRMTRVSPQVFRSLRSTRIRLDGNPWDCSCGADDFDFLQDLQSKSLLDRQEEVTCESPPSLRGRPVWNVSVCATSPPPPPRPTAVSQTIQPKPNDIITTVPPSSAVTRPPSRPTSETNASVQPKPTDAPTVTSSHTAPPGRPTSATRTSGQPKPTDAPTVTSSHTAPPARPTSDTRTSGQPKPTDAPTVTSSHTAPPARPTSATRTSGQPKPTDAPTVTSSHTAPPARPTSETRTSGQPKATHNLPATTTPALKTETYVTEISVRPKPTDLPTPSPPTGMNETCVTSRAAVTNNVSTLVVVIVVLSSLLVVTCFLVVLYGRKRSNKTVTPACPEENRNEWKEDSIKSSRAQSLGDSEKSQNNHRDSELEWRRSFSGVRAKSANAIFFTSPFCAPMKDQVTLQTETEVQSRDKENQTDGKQKQGSETHVDGGFETENLTSTTDVNTKQAADGINLDQDPSTVTYLNIGTNQIKHDFNKPSIDGQGQRSQMGKAMGRISTWLPTAVQWQVKCKMMKEEEEKEEEEGSDAFTFRPPKFQVEMSKLLNKVEHSFGEDEIEKNQTEDSLKLNDAQKKEGHSQSSKPNDETTSISSHTDMKQEEMMIRDPAPVTLTTKHLNQEQAGQAEHLKPGEKPPNKGSNKTEQRREAKQAGTSRPSPDDETLLSGNEYAFMDLLHEVVQNNGRWTRERWRQTHVNKKRH